MALSQSDSYGVAPMLTHPMHRFDDLANKASPSSSSSSSSLSTHGAPHERGWSPYVSNGGTVLGIAGSDYCVIAGDTRMSTGYRIYTRDKPKVTKLTDKCVIATGGMEAECNTLHKVLRVQVTMYEHHHRKAPSVSALAQLLSTILYYKRFFPYYTFNVLGGVDDDGTGKCYGYDAIGSYESVPYVSQGTGVELIMSVLDNRIKENNQTVKRSAPLTKDEAVELSKDVLTSACERDIFTGDSANIIIITASGILEQELPMKRD